MGSPPRAFMSYARADGEAFAEELCRRLERDEPEITFWRDRDGMEGGRDWWKQITDALDQVQFLVLVVTPGSLNSQPCREEWRYARKQGVCVYPVMGAPDMGAEFAKLPRWMSRAHCFDLEHEWETFVTHLKGPCLADRVPFAAPDLPTRHVPRTEVLATLLDAVRDSRQNPVAGTVALCGAGGFGKTTLAAALCRQDDVLTVFRSGVLWVTLGEEPDLRGALTKLYAGFTGQRPAFVDEEDAAAQLAARFQDKACLVVLDDLWDVAHLKRFPRAGTEVTWLVTTRSREVATAADREVAVDEMTPEEAVGMLSGWLSPAPAEPADAASLRALAERLGEWPLLLDLAGSTLRQRVDRGETLDQALAYLGKALDKRGFTAFDRRNPTERNQAVTRTLSVSLDHLEVSERERYFELSTLPEDAAVPLAAAEVLWGMDELDVEDLADRLDDLSLVRLDLRDRRLRIHDVVRRYAGERLEEEGRAGRVDLLCRAALARATLEREERRPKRIFELARQGRLKAAERQLGRFEAEPVWQQMALATAAWLAASSAPEEARAVRDQLAGAVADPVAGALIQRLAALPEDAPPPAPNLPDPPDPGLAEEMVQRLGGGNVSAIEPLAVEGLSDEGPAYLARQDGPRLVALAATAPADASGPLDRYIATLAANEYEWYRNRSLWFLIEPVLQVADTAWVQERLCRMIEAALSGARPEFDEALSLAAVALLAAGGDPSARQEFDGLRKQAVDACGTLLPSRGQGDLWSHHLRRLCALAEASAVALKDPAGAEALIRQALALDPGFAGFRAPACLTLAESVRICLPGDTDLLQEALRAARKAAHNIQDPTFCARATARVAALEQEWWAGPFDPAAATAHLQDEPGGPGLCSLHRVGEHYGERTPGPHMMPNPAVDRRQRTGQEVETLRGLAETYHFAEAAFLEVNHDQGWGLDDPLPVGAQVAVPDPGFASMLAARVAAETLTLKAGAPPLPPGHARTLLRAAPAEPTVLDTVAARLLLAASAAGRENLERVRAAAEAHRRYRVVPRGTPSQG